MWVFDFTGVGAPTPLCLRLSCTFICAAYAVSAVTPSFDLQADGYGQYDPRGWGWVHRSSFADPPNTGLYHKFRHNNSHKTSRWNAEIEKMYNTTIRSYLETQGWLRN